MALVKIVIPTFLIFLSGFLLEKKFRVDIKPISTLSIYLLTPVLIFRTFYLDKLTTQFDYIALVQLLLFIALIVVTKLLCSVFRYDSANENALMLTTAFMNSGNYGAPIILFAFGEKGFNEAVFIMVLHTLMSGIFAVYFASRGKSSFKEAIMNILRLPNIYAVLLGLLFQYARVPVFSSLQQAIDLVGEATIPVVMIAMGMQLATIHTRDIERKLVTLGTSIRLLMSPFLAWGICSLFPIDNLSKNVMIVIAAMPSAATALMYAVQYEAKPQLVSSITLVSTILSFVTISIVLGILG